MKDKDLEAKLSESQSYHISWTQLSLSQFAYTSNLFTTVGIGFLEYLFINRDKYPDMYCGHNAVFNLELFIFLLTIILVLISIIIGILSMLYIDFMI